MQITIENKGIDFDSPYTNATAAVEFRRLFENGDLDSDFAHSIYAGARQYKRYTDRQLPWLHVIIANHENRATKPNAGINGPALTGLHLIHAHLLACRTRKEEGGKGLLHPMVGLQVGDQQVVLKLAGAKSKNNGKVSVASDRRYGQGDFYGWIDADGNMTSKGMPDAAKDILRRVGQDPATVISQIGKESGRCCYCFAELSRVGSKIAGCGKTCAANYGTDYPKAADIRAHVIDHPGVLEGSSDRDKWEPNPVSHTP